jgi:hypothetical protein
MGVRNQQLRLGSYRELEESQILNRARVDRKRQRWLPISQPQKWPVACPFSQREEVKMRVARQRIIHEELIRRELAGGEGFEPSQSEPESNPTRV